MDDNNGNNNQYLYVLCIITGFLILIYPTLVAYIIALFLIVYGVLEIIK